MIRYDSNIFIFREIRPICRNIFVANLYWLIYIVAILKNILYETFLPNFALFCEILKVILRYTKFTLHFFWQNPYVHPTLQNCSKSYNKWSNNSAKSINYLF